MLRGAAAVIVVGAIVAVIVWPDTCVAGCEPQNPFDIVGSGGPVFDRHVVPRILLATAGVTLGTVITALTFSRKRD